MTAKQLNEKYTNKEGAKTLLWLVIAALIIMFSVQIMKVLRGVFGFITGKTSDEEIAAKNETEANKVQALIKESGYSQTTLPKPMTYYMSIADSLEEAMQGWGTDSDTMLNLLKPLTDNELKAVYLKFGSRINDDFGNDAGNLFTWFKWELSDYSPFSVGALTRMRLIWKKTGLPITF